MQLRIVTGCLLLIMTGSMMMGCLKESLGNNGGGGDVAQVISVMKGFQSQSMASDPSAMWIEDDGKMEKVKRVLFGQEMGEGEQPLPEANFSTHALLLIHMGRKPTAGYALELLSETATVRKGVATVKLKWTQPGKDMFTAQVMTSPYILLKLEKKDFGVIQIEDEKGNVRLKLSI